MINSPILNIPRFDSWKILSKYPEDSLRHYLEMVWERNRKFNLVSRETTKVELTRMAADSLVPFEFISCPMRAIFDIGPGAGFPSIVILLAFPGIEAVLYERTRKKGLFLEAIIREFGVNARVVMDDFVGADYTLSNGFECGFMKYVKLDRKILSRALSFLIPSGQFIYFSKISSSLIPLDSDINIATFSYYLDDVEQIRTLTTFKRKN